MTSPVIPPGHLIPPPETVVGRITLSLQMNGHLHMDTDIQRPGMAIDMLRKAADAIERQQRPAPGQIVVEGGKATLVKPA